MSSLDRAILPVGCDGAGNLLASDTSDSDWCKVRFYVRENTTVNVEVHILGDEDTFFFFKVQ